MTRSHLVTILGALLTCAFMSTPAALADEPAVGDSTVLATAARGETEITIDTYIAAAEASVDQFAAQSGLARAQWVNLSGSEIARSACGVTASASFAYFYCSYDGLTYVGTVQAMRYIDGTDYLAGALIIAHEWGHHLQHVAMGSFVDDKNHENGADCVGGAWLRWFSDTQRLNLDLADAMGFWNLAVKIETPAERQGIHGTRFERASAMFNGYVGGLGACNAYTPTV